MKYNFFKSKVHFVLLIAPIICRKKGNPINAGKKYRDLHSKPKAAPVDALKLRTVKENDCGIPSTDTGKS